MSYDLMALARLLIDIIKFLIWDIWETLILPISLHFHDLQVIEKEADQQYNLPMFVETMKSIDVETEL
jgi:hypothetical protein